ncbi:MAG: nucleotide exchange factor GrpE [Phycisphaerales bacterium]|jgi:molecular chaperone GrpE|nr:nucleotide exchange factor GrpE [Phycisphaerales bacterium]MDP6890051.1 nucleotide exchange factor GrpE [Phycisphaerales bacterium]
MNTEELPIEDLNDDDQAVSDANETQIDDALVGQIIDESEGDQREVLEWLAAALEDARADRLRALAELANNQRRAAENEVRVSRAAVAGAIRSLLTVSDQIDMALGQDLEDMTAEQFAQGVQLASDEFTKVLGDLGVTRIDPEVGDEFDPQRHEAMLQRPADGIDSGHITMLMQPGFATEHHVLRAAKVAVAP